MGVKPQRSDHCGVWVEFFLRYHLSETGIAFGKKTLSANTFKRVLNLWVQTAALFFSFLESGEELLKGCDFRVGKAQGRHE
jgi:hypothetical protein